MKARAWPIAFGVAFGFVLSRVGATDYDAITSMFRLRDLHLAKVMMLAIALSSAGFAWLRRHRPLHPSGAPLNQTTKPMTSSLPVGALLFGAGWALSGTCPGTALAQVGEGRLAALATLAGILSSSALVEAWQARRG